MKLNITRFAIEASNYTTLTSSAGNKARLEVSWIENSTNTTNNTSNITVTGRIRMTSGSYSQDSVPYLKIYWHNSDTNTDTFIKQAQVSSLDSSWYTIYDSINVTHKADGTSSGYGYAEWTGSSFAYTPRAGSVATSNTNLTNIPRASSISATTANIGSASTITINRAVSSFTHTVTYSFANGAVSGTIATKTSSTSLSLTLPTSLYAQIPNSNSINGTITCTTYNGNAEIGTSTCTITANVPSTATPTVTNPTITDTDTVSKNTIQLYVQGKSKLQFDFTNTFSSSYSATLKLYTLKINGTQVYSDNLTTYTMTTPLTGTTNTYELIVTDSRGLTATTGEQTITAYAYSAPTCSINAERNSTTPTTVNITYSGTITNINNNNRNAKSFKIEYKQSTASSWTTITTVTDGYVKTNATVNRTGVDDSHGFDFRITATDSYNQPATATISIGTSATLINFNTNGQTLALGKASEISDTFEIALKTEFQDEVNITSASNFKINNTVLSTVINDAVKNVLSAAYPVGAIYISTSSTNPGTLFGFGTWTQITDDAYLKIVSSNGGTLGGTSSDHKIPLTSMPSHTHPAGTNNSFMVYSGSIGFANGSYYTRGNQNNTGAAGGGQAYYPYYYGIYVFKRTA